MQAFEDRCVKSITDCLHCLEQRVRGTGQYANEARARLIALETKFQECAEFIERELAADRPGDRPSIIPVVMSVMHRNPMETMK